jgi:peptide deformylase
MLLMMNTLNQPEALKYFANRYFSNSDVTRIGAAVAAPQINCPVQAFLMYDHTIPNYIFFINPNCKPDAGSTTWNSITQEGCLSIPNLAPLAWGSADTKRQTAITVDYYTFFGPDDKPITLDTTTGACPTGTTIRAAQYLNTYTPPPTTPAQDAANMLNWIVQHEIDHLKGILYTDYVSLGSDYDKSSDATAENNARLVLYVAQQNECINPPKYPSQYDQSLAEKEIGGDPLKQLSGEQAALIYG